MRASKQMGRRAGKWPAGVGREHQKTTNPKQ